MNPIEERITRGNTAIDNAAKRGQSTEDQLVEALADLRAWSAHVGVPFAVSVASSRERYIHDRVKASSVCQN